MSGGPPHDASPGARTTSYARDDEPAAPTRWARLCIVSPRELAGVHPLPLATMIGREPGPGGVSLLHGTVSRRHLELRAEGAQGVFVATDQGSRNGSWINAVPVSDVPRLLRSGDVLRLGEVVAVFEQGHDVLEDRSATSRDAVIGRSAEAVALRNAIARAATDASPVLVVGESGTGKEAVAHELHRLSGRAGPLVIANCATLTASLADSQLFGHERGAFTGAVRSQPGLFRSADGGSLFLDEIGELPLELQPKLLRAVERGEVVPLGDTRTLTVDTRIIAATHRDLAAAVAAGSFRRDLYARLSLVRIRVPPLAERRADLLAWIDVLHGRWQGLRDAEPRPPLELSAEAVETLLLHEWPENLRGLDQLVRALAMLDEPGRVTRARLASCMGLSTASATVPLPPRTLASPLPTIPLPPRRGPSPAPTPSTPADTPREPRAPKPTREALLVVLEAHGWNLRAVARHYGRDRRQIYRWLDELGLELRR